MKMNEDTCIICLANNIRIVNIANTYLQGVYERIIDVKLDDYRHFSLCYICLAKLKQCNKLIKQAEITNRFLQDILNHSVENTHETCFPLIKLTSEAVNQISVVVIEDERLTELNVKEELANEESNGSVEDQDNIKNVEESDSEDDLPLKQISVKEERKAGVSVRGKRERRRRSESVDAKQITLSMEEQIAEIKERANSLNYLNSPYKCPLCYKGFINPYAFEKHKEKHEKCSGDFECSVCHLRYVSSRQLRAHTVAAHVRRFDCTQCSHRAHTRNQAKDHERWHRGHTYPCQLCGLKFSKPTSYLTHIRKLHSSENVCEKCGESFVGRHGLLLHLSKSHKRDEQETEQTGPPEERYCGECGIQFVTTTAWKRHILTSAKHSAWNHKSPICEICGLNLSPVGRRAHMRLHAQALRPKYKDGHEKGPALAKLPCDQCEASFTTRSRLQAHIRTVHLGLKYNKNLVCEVCGKNCTSLATLRYHQRRHTGERPYACACGARFADSNQRRIHARAHSGERPYPCALCGKAFSQKPALNKHHRVHTGAKPYECQMCHKGFSQSNSLKLHVRTVHLKLPPNNKKKTAKTKIDD